jgi:hypothetical protein
MTIEYWLHDPIAIVELVFFLVMGVIAAAKLRGLASPARHQTKNNNDNSNSINYIPEIQKGKHHGIISFLKGIRQNSRNNSGGYTDKHNRKDNTPFHSDNTTQ